MSWLKVDDAFADHPKMLELTRADRWRWLELLCLVARYRTAGHVTPGMLKAADIAPRLRAQLLELRLLEHHAGAELHVHDWQEYNPPRDPTNAERQARHRAKKRAQLAGENRSEAEHATPPTSEHGTPMDTGETPPRNALPVTVQQLPPVPVPVTAAKAEQRKRADEQTRELERRLAARRREGSPGTVDAAGELERLRSGLPAMPSWAPDGASGT